MMIYSRSVIHFYYKAYKLKLCIKIHRIVSVYYTTINAEFLKNAATESFRHIQLGFTWLLLLIR